MRDVNQKEKPINQGGADANAPVDRKVHLWLSKQERRVDALASGADEGRDKLR